MACRRTVDRSARRRIQYLPPIDRTYQQLRPPFLARFFLSSDEHSIYIIINNKSQAGSVWVRILLWRSRLNLQMPISSASFHKIANYWKPYLEGNRSVVGIFNLKDLRHLGGKRPCAYPSAQLLAHSQINLRWNANSWGSISTDMLGGCGVV
jgi:hypothetical protein